MASMARISRSRRRRGVSGGSPGSRQLFLEGDDRLRPLQLPLEPAILRLELLDARVDGAGRLAPAAPAHLPQARPPRAAAASSSAATSTTPRAVTGAPTSPGFLHASACVRMRSRYSAEKRRRWTVAGTSGSGSGGRDRVDLHDFWHASHLSNPPRPYTNLTREVVSQIIGTGGRSTSVTSSSPMWNAMLRTGSFVTHRMMRVSSSTRSSANVPALATR